jgi:GT2 family glycosyltransferase
MMLPQRVAAVAGASFAVRRDVWAALGGLDEAFFMYYEETDLSWRAQLAGYSCLYVPGSVVYHDYRPSRLNTRAVYYAARNRWVMLFKNWKWATLVLLAPGLLLADLVDWGLAMLRGKSAFWAKMRASMWVVLHLPEIIRLRPKTQSLRTVPDALLLSELTPQLMPVEVTGGVIGRALVSVASVLFDLHYRGMIWLVGNLNL